MAGQRGAEAGTDSCDGWSGTSRAARGSDPAARAPRQLPRARLKEVHASAAWHTTLVTHDVTPLSPELPTEHPGCFSPINQTPQKGLNGQVSRADEGLLSDGPSSSTLAPPPPWPFLTPLNFLTQDSERRPVRLLPCTVSSFVPHACAVQAFKSTVIRSLSNHRLGEAFFFFLNLKIHSEASKPLIRISMSELNLTLLRDQLSSI